MSATKETFYLGPISEKYSSKESVSRPKPATFLAIDPEKAQPPSAEVLPDGGSTAWLTVIGAWFVLFATYGYLYAFGVYQDYYTRIYLSNKTPSEISWIGSTQYTMPFLLGIVSGGLFDKGVFYSLEIAGSTIFIFSLFMLSLAKENQYYQIFLAQGVGMGLGLGLVFIPTVSITTHHFSKKRALAGGIAFSGSAVGAIIFPIILNNLLPTHSFGYSVRVSGYVALPCLVIGNLLMRTRLPPRPKLPPPIAEFFREPSYILSNIAGLCMSFGLVFPVFYIQLFAITHGLDRTLAFYSLAILNGASVFGRVIGNHLADVFGPFTVLVPSAFGTGISIWLMLIMNNTASLASVSVIYGFFSGGYLSLCIAALASLAKRPSDIGSKTGISLALSSFALLGSTPSHGALLTPEYHWIRPIAFSGTFALASGLFFLAARQLVVKEKGTQRV